MNSKSLLLSAVVTIGLTAAAVAQTPPTILGDPPPLPGLPTRTPTELPRRNSQPGPVQPFETPPRTRDRPFGPGQLRDHGGHSHAPAPAPSYIDRAPSLVPALPDPLPRYEFAEPEFSGPQALHHDYCPSGWKEGSRGVCPLGRDRLNHNAFSGAGFPSHVYPRTYAPHYCPYVPVDNAPVQVHAH